MEANDLAFWLNGKTKDDDEWRTILTHPYFDCFMLEYCFKQFWQFLSSISETQSLEDAEAWWKFSGAITELNMNHMTAINASKI